MFDPDFSVRKAHMQAMPARKPRDPDEKPFAERFQDMARELECEEDMDAFKEKLGRIARQRPKVEPKKTSKD